MDILTRAIDELPLFRDQPLAAVQGRALREDRVSRGGETAPRDAWGRYLDIRSFRHDESIIIEGARDLDFFVVLAGHARAVARVGRAEDEVGRFGPGDFFGEIAPRTLKPRTATISADGHCIVLAVDWSLFDQLYRPGTSFNRIVAQAFRDRNERAVVRGLVA